MKIDEGDQLLTPASPTARASSLIATKGGQSIRFPEDQVRPMGRPAYGVKGIELDEGDEVVGMVVTRSGAAARARGVRATATASARRSRSSASRTAAARAIILIDASDRNGPVVGVSS